MPHCTRSPRSTCQIRSRRRPARWCCWSCAAPAPPAPCCRCRWWRPPRGRWTRGWSPASVRTRCWWTGRTTRRSCAAGWRPPHRGRERASHPRTWTRPPVRCTPGSSRTPRCASRDAMPGRRHSSSCSGCSPRDPTQRSRSLRRCATSAGGTSRTCWPPSTAPGPVPTAGRCTATWACSPHSSQAPGTGSSWPASMPAPDGT